MAVYREWKLSPDITLWRSTDSGQSLVPADGCVDLIMSEETLLVAGPSIRRLVTTIESGAAVCGLRFAPGFAGDSMRLNVAQICDRLVPLGEVTQGNHRRLLEKMAADYFDSPYQHVKTPSRWMGSCAGWIQLIRQAAQAGLPPDEGGNQLGWGERHLRRQMVSAFGYGYPILVRVLRSQRASALIRSGLDLSDAAFRAGYADQPHMTREVLRFTGRTPGKIRAGLEP